VADARASRLRTVVGLICAVVATAAVIGLLSGGRFGALQVGGERPSAAAGARAVADAIAAHAPSQRWIVSCQDPGPGLPAAPCIVYAVLPAGSPLDVAYRVTWDARAYLRSTDVTDAGVATEVLPASVVAMQPMIDDVVCGDAATTRRFTFLAMGGELDPDLPTADAYAEAAASAQCRLVHVAPVIRERGYVDRAPSP
jgi:hypothetical protein